MRSAAFIWLLLLYARPPISIQASDENEDKTPQIKEHPLDVLVVKNDPATLRCNVSGENVQVVWYKDNQPVNIGNAAHKLVLPNGSLFLLRADHDLGTYHCTATNRFGTISSQKAHVRQATLRDEFRVRPHNVNAVLGKSAIMECAPPKGFPEPSVIWRKDDKDLPRDVDRFKVHQSGNLIIEDVQRSDTGLYTCIAWNMVGERISGPARLFVSEKPAFLVEPKDTVAEVNSSVLFDCRVSGEPQPTVSWKKRSRHCTTDDEYSKCSDNMPIGRAYITDDSRGLRIDRIQPSDEGEFVCHAKNGAGEIESSARLRVNSPPFIIRVPLDITATIGQRAVFNCEAAGRPRPGVFWSKEGDPLFTFMSGHRSSDNRIEVTEAGSLILNTVKSTDKGVYVCAAVNSAGSALKRAALHIEIDASQASPPPLIIYGPSPQTLLVHDIAILPCQVAGDDQPNITWYHNSEKVLQDTRTSQSVSGTLRISDLKKLDSGDYICQVESALGSDKWSAHLQVEEHNNPSAVFDRMPDKAALPSSPLKPRIKIAKNGALELEWNAPEHLGETPITHYTVRYWSAINDNPLTWTTVTDKITTTNYQLQQPKSGATYFFIVRANNAKGAGEPSTVTHLTYSNGVDLRSQDDITKQDQHPLITSKSVKLNSVYSINTTSALLTWTNPDTLQNDGFYLTWRGPPLSTSQTIMNITDAKSTSAIIEGLRPFSSYDFFLIPYKRQTNLSPSNSMELLTPEGKPAPPRSVFARMENITSVMIAFSPPNQNEVNGVLRGFDIRFVDNSSSYENTIRTKANARSITLKNMRPGNAYQAHIAAFNGAGRSDFVSTDMFTMNEETLKKHQELYGDTRRVAAAPAFWLGLGGGLLALMVFLLLAFVWCKRWKGQKKPLRIVGGSRNCPPCDDFANIKINDGSIAVGQSEQYWPENGSMPFHLPPPPLQNHQHGNHAMPQLSTSPRTPPHYYSQHACCPAAAAAQNQMVMNAYGTTMRHQHYSGPYNMSSTSTLNRNGDDGHQYHYAVLPSTLPHHHHSAMIANSIPFPYEDDPSPYASTTITSNGYGPPIPSNPIPPPPAMFALQHHHFAPHQQMNGGPHSTSSIRRHTSGRRTPRTNPHCFTPANERQERQVPGPAPMNNRNGETELSKILSQVRPPLTYDSVTDDLAVPNYTDNGDQDELSSRVLNSRSPPRTIRPSTTDESEERNLLHT